MGSEEVKYIITVIGTHQARIRCLLTEITKNRISFKKFKNCCILEIKIESGPNKSSVNLVYEGEGDDSENVYGKFNKIEFTYNCELYNNKYKFYLIRHGEGIHNVYNIFLKPFKSLLNRDTELTSRGKDQAERAGRELNQILKNNDIEHIYISDLKRTFQTLELVLATNWINTIPPRYKILPCNHELIYTSKTKCDGNQKSIPHKTLAGENIPKYLIENLGLENIDIELYKSFYKGDRMKKGKKPDKCRENNMLTLAISDINSNNTNGGGYKTRRTRRTRRTLNKTRRTRNKTRVTRNKTRGTRRTRNKTRRTRNENQ